MGYYSNSIVYIGQGSGSFLAVSLMDKVGDRRTMVIASIMCLPYIAAFLIPAFKSVNTWDNNWYFGTPFVYALILVLSLVNGFGEGFV